MTCWPSPSLSRCATARATMSRLPPGTSGTMMRTGLAGYAWAWRTPGRAARNAAVSRHLHFTLFPYEKALFAPPASVLVSPHSNVAAGSVFDGLELAFSGHARGHFFAGVLGHPPGPVRPPRAR